MRLWFCLLVTAGLASAETYSYWIQPCSRELSEDSGCEATDTELAEWALGAWQNASRGALSFARIPYENKALLRIYWARGALYLYGETRPILVEGKRGSAIYVRPDLAQLGPDIAAAGSKDRLFRHAIVYLTCLHESGHALGLPHTAHYDDIMYSFGYGGDIVEYFARYRRKLNSRDQIRQQSGISRSDQESLQALYVR